MTIQSHPTIEKKMRSIHDNTKRGLLGQCNYIKHNVFKRLVILGRNDILAKIVNEDTSISVIVARCESKYSTIILIRNR